MRQSYILHGVLGFWGFGGVVIVVMGVIVMV